MPIFRPSCQVRLQLYLDEGAKLVQPKVPQKSAGFGLMSSVSGALEKNLADRAALGAIKGTLSLPEFEKTKRQLDLERDALEAMDTGPKQSFPNGVDPKLSAADNMVIFTAIPIMATVSRAPTKDADTAQIIFAFRDVPIDPRCMRSAFVAITLGTVERDDYVDGMVKGKRRGSDGSPLSLVKHEEGQEKLLHSSTRFVGYVATWECSFEEGGDTITLNCIDMSCVMRQQKLLGHHIDLLLPIEVGVQRLIDEFVTSKGVKVVLGTPLGDDVQKPTGNLIPADAIPKPLKTKRGKVAQSKQKSEEMTVWDHIADNVFKLGLTPIMRHFTLYLVESRLLFRDLLHSVRMVYGSNVQHLKITRKMEGITTDTIEVRCPDRSIGRVMWARYPVLNGEPTSGILGKPGSPQPTVSRATKITPNGTGHEQVRVLNIRGIASLAALEKIAEATFNEMGRQEIFGTFGTHEIDSFESKVEGDLLDLQSGDAVAVLIAQQNEKRVETGANTLQELQAMSVAARQKYLEGLGIATKQAEKLALAQEQAQLQSVFRCGMVTIRWTVDDGVSVESDFYNFIVVREDPNHPGQALGGKPKNLSKAMESIK